MSSIFSRSNQISWHPFLRYISMSDCGNLKLLLIDFASELFNDSSEIGKLFVIEKLFFLKATTESWQFNQIKNRVSAEIPLLRLFLIGSKWKQSSQLARSNESKESLPHLLFYLDKRGCQTTIFENISHHLSPIMSSRFPRFFLSIIVVTLMFLS